MKNKAGNILVICLTVVALMTSGMAYGEILTTTILKTDKTVYLMDPYHWVYTAPEAVWPDAGHDRTVTFDINLYDEVGQPVDYTGINFKVYDGAALFASGDVTPTEGPGAYQGAFDLTETNLGGDGFSGQDPKELELKILNASEVVMKEDVITVGRWGCDRCHVGANTAQTLYNWCSPSGGEAPASPHNWVKILGGAKPHGGFDLTFLTDAENTHTPEYTLNYHPFHEKTFRKSGGSAACSPCHQGSGRVRQNYSGTPWPAVSYRSEAVYCTFCHGMEGGYVPTTGLWHENAGYISAGHRHENVPPPPFRWGNPFLAWQSCANSGCHGHIKDDKDGEILRDKPNCRDCHGIHVESLW